MRSWPLFLCLNSRVYGEFSSANLFISHDPVTTLYVQYRSLYIFMAELTWSCYYINCCSIIVSTSSSCYCTLFGLFFQIGTKNSNRGNLFDKSRKIFLFYSPKMGLSTTIVLSLFIFVSREHATYFLVEVSPGCLTLFFPAIITFAHSNMYIYT
jgi:hypothetical protein